MPWLPFFADEADIGILLNWLNSEADIAFIVSDEIPDSPQPRWKAVQTINAFKNGHYTLWHVPTGELSFFPESSGSRQFISNPWQGWTEPPLQALYANSTAQIHLDLWLRHQPYSRSEKKTLPLLHSWWLQGQDVLVASDFEWIGDRYSQAPQLTWRWWRRLKGLIDRKATRLKPSGEQWSFRAFPSALGKLKGGMAYEAKGWDLDEAIRTADDPIL